MLTGKQSDLMPESPSPAAEIAFPFLPGSSPDADGAIRQRQIYAVRPMIMRAEALFTPAANCGLYNERW